LRGTEGNLTGSTTSAVWEVTVPVGDAPVNTSWGTTLDIDGDGYADLAVGAHVVSMQGAAYVYPGSAKGIVDSPVVLLNPLQWYGAFVTSGGDIDGDGFPELIVTSNQAFGGQGGMLIYRGGPAWASMAPTVMVGPNTMYEYGGWVQSAGDVNGDGYGDLFVSAVDPKDHATAFLYLGSPTGLVPSSQTLAAGVLVALSAVTDINGDGFSDVVLTVDGSNANSGSIEVYLGSANGVFGSPTVVTYTGNTPQSWFFVNVTAAGDVNGDGYGDIMVSTIDAAPLSVRVYLGGAAGLSSSPLTLPNPGTWTEFGARLAGVGDIDADGFDDIACGLGGPDPRTAYVYRGGPSGPSSVPSITLSPPPMTTGGFADPLAGLGDVNRDGFADVGVGAITSNAFVYLGAPSGLLAAPQSVSAPAGVSSFSESLD
jgi:hypothetical protein